MKLKQLLIRNFRNHSSINWHCHPQFNLLIGANGCGKTSVLEAITLLAQGRSFRSYKVEDYIKRGEVRTSVYGRIIAARELEHSLGVEKTLDNCSSYKIDYKPMAQRFLYAQFLPLQIIHASSFELLHGSSKYRREFLDWMLFHVEPEFASRWHNYQRLLNHCNILLKKRDLAALDIWLVPLAQEGMWLSKRRLEVFTAFKQQFEAKYSDYELNISLGFEGELSASLATNLPLSLRRGHLITGPQRADMEIFYQNMPAAQYLSRGQTKTLLYALILQRAEFVAEYSGKVPLLLLDEVAAELDHAALAKLLSIVQQTKMQVFITGVEEHYGRYLDSSSYQLFTEFHVEPKLTLA